MTDQPPGWFGDLSRLVNKDGRIIREARMLPRNEELTAARRAEIIAHIKDFLARHNITQVQVARQMGDLSASNISAILSGSYDHAKLDEHLVSLNNWMEGEATRRATRPDNDYVDTHVARQIIGCAKKVIEYGCMGVAYGPTGVGKTMVAHVICERYHGTIYHMAGEGMRNYTALRRTIGNVLRVFSSRQKRQHQGLPIGARVMEKLRGSHRLILIDEAHQLDESSLNYLRTLHDQCGVPVMMMSTIDLVQRLRRDNDEDHGQLYSRIGYVVDVTRGRDKVPGGRKPLFTLSEIRQLFESDQVRLAPDGQGYLMDVANSLGQGSLRRCKYVMRWACMIERTAHGLGPRERITITAKLLRKAEAEPLCDDVMMEDIRARTASVARTA